MIRPLFINGPCCTQVAVAAPFALRVIEGEKLAGGEITTGVCQVPFGLLIEASITAGAGATLAPHTAISRPLVGPAATCGAKVEPLPGGATGFAALQRPWAGRVAASTVVVVSVERSIATPGGGVSVAG